MQARWSDLTAGPEAAEPDTISSRDGFTLIEVLVSITLLLVVGGTVLTMLEIGVRTEPKITQRSQRIADGRVALERMTRELRQTYSVRTTGSTEIDVLTYLRSNSASALERRVLYQCGDGQCLRSEAAPNEAFAGSGTLFLDGVENPDVFSYSPNTISPEFIKVKLVLSIPGQGATITLSDGVNLRNATSFDD